MNSIKTKKVQKNLNLDEQTTTSFHFICIYHSLSETSMRIASNNKQWRITSVILDLRTRRLWMQ